MLSPNKFCKQSVIFAAAQFYIKKSRTDRAGAQRGQPRWERKPILLYIAIVLVFAPCKKMEVCRARGGGGVVRGGPYETL